MNLLLNDLTPTLEIYKQFNQPLSIAHTFNNYFCNTESELASALPKSSYPCECYVNNNGHKLKFSAISEAEVFLLLDQLDTKKSFGMDRVQPFM